MINDFSLSKQSAIGLRIIELKLMQTENDCLKKDVWFKLSRMKMIPKLK